MRNICVYCGSTSGVDPHFISAARHFGRALAERGYQLVFGGVGLGLMGAVADGALSAGGRVIGIIPKPLLAMEVAHSHLTELHVVEDMHERKRMMAERADAFVVMPGGCGTMDEFFEIFTWSQLGFNEKPIAILNGNGYYDPLFAFMRSMIRQGFLKEVHFDMLIVESNHDTLLERMQNYVAPHISKWSKGSV
jgi:uncharacterized protein (TIGR00730 family)